MPSIPIIAPINSKHVAAALVATAALIFTPAWSASAMADDEDEGGPFPGIPDTSIGSSLPQRLADPGGVRSRLARYGIQFGVNYIGEVLGNPSGGIKQSTHYDGVLDVVLEADMEKMIGWKGLTFFANGYQIHGTSISGENLGSLAAVSNIEAFPSTRLFELWFEQKLLDNKLSVRLVSLRPTLNFSSPRAAATSSIPRSVGRRSAQTTSPSVARSILSPRRAFG